MVNGLAILPAVKAAIALGLVVEEVNGKKNLFFVLNLATGTPA